MVHCWFTIKIHLPTDPPRGESSRSVRSLYYTCGLLTDGRIRGWGSERLQRTAARLRPLLTSQPGRQSTQGTFEAMSAGWEHACVWNDSGRSSAGDKP